MKIVIYILIFLWCFNSCSPIYVLRAGYTEARILSSRKDIKEALTEDEIDAPTKEKLRTILQVKEFSSELGLTPRGSYSSYSDLKDLPPSYVITAVDSMSLTPITWWYPIVGSIPYKGYHDKEDAIEEAKEIKLKGYDVSVRDSIAFSTLGWFDDPVLQTVLKQDISNIIITVLHEIMHSTLWIPNHPDFNETMAEVIGLVSALEFAKKESPNLEEGIKKRFRYECEVSVLYEDTYQSLNNVFNSGEEKEIIIEKKEQIYEGLSSKLFELRKSLLNLDPANNRIETFNNASFLSSYIYLKEFTSFIALYLNVDRSSIKLIDALKSMNQENPYQELKKMLGSDMQEGKNLGINICNKL